MKLSSGSIIFIFALSTVCFCSVKIGKLASNQESNLYATPFEFETCDGIDQPFMELVEIKFDDKDGKIRRGIVNNVHATAEVRRTQEVTKSHLLIDHEGKTLFDKDLPFAKAYNQGDEITLSRGVLLPIFTPTGDYSGLFKSYDTEGVEVSCYKFSFTIYTKGD